MTKKRKQRDFLTREMWLRAAYRRLVDRGIDGVKILSLAEDLGVTRGSFYWRFSSLNDLLGELFGTWRATNTTALIQAADARPASLGEWYVNLMSTWLQGSLFDVRLDIAVRDWARKDKTVFELVQAEDKIRIARLQAAFEELGGMGQRYAFTRARILYYQQMGYYMTGVQDPPELRAGYLMEYCGLLTGIELGPEEVRELSASLGRSIDQ